MSDQQGRTPDEATGDGFGQNSEDNPDATRIFDPSTPDEAAGSEDATPQQDSDGASGDYQQDQSQQFNNNNLGQGQYGQDQPQQYNQDQGYGQYGQDQTQQFGAYGQDQGQGYGQDQGYGQYGQDQTQQFGAYGQDQGQGYGQYGQDQTQQFGAYGQDQGGYPAPSAASGQAFGQAPSAPSAPGYGQTYPPAQGFAQGGGGGYGNFNQYGGGYGEEPKKGKGALIAWIVLGVLLIAGATIGILFATGVFGGSDDDKPTGDETTAEETTGEETTDPSTEDTDTDGPETTESGTANSYGDDPALDELWDKCEGGDMEACDELYWESDISTEYEEFGSTCGGTAGATYGRCADSGGTNSSTAAPGTYGADPALDELWDKCESGDMQACDALYWQSGIGSEYESFGSTCGGRDPMNRNGGCASMGGESSDSGAMNSYGDNSELDELWDKCEDGDMAACDDLYWGSTFGSEYEEFAATCGDRDPQATGGRCDQ